MPQPNYVLGMAKAVVTTEMFENSREIEIKLVCMV